MKVLLVNGSPKEHGCTFTALSEIKKVLESEEIEAEIVQVGNKPILGCIGCGACYKLKKCAFDNGGVNEFVEKAREADGFIIGSPVHYAATSGAITSFLDRAFYSGKSAFIYKPGAAIVSCRRGGATATFDQLNKYFTISNMPVISSNYWNMVHGNTPDEVKQDLEGIQTMQILAKNMAWILKAIDAGKKVGIDKPAEEPKVKTNFIR